MTSCCAVPVLPEPSVAVQVTRVAPGGSPAGGASCESGTFASTMSRTYGLPHRPGQRGVLGPAAAAVHTNAIVTSGGVVSTTVTFCTAAALLP